MSIHAQLTPEAQARLEQQRRNSVISSVLIAALTLVLLGVILWALYNTVIIQEPEDVQAYSIEAPDDTEVTQDKIQQQVKRKPTSASASQSRTIVSNVQAQVAVPTVDEIITDPADDFGSLGEFGDGVGDTGDDGNQGNTGIPAVLKKRCSPEDRMSRLRESGGTPECEEAVTKALKFLAEAQNENGSWGYGKYDVGQTAMALLVFFGRCETPASSEYGAEVLKGINFLINVSQQNDGRLAHNFGDNHWPYEHAMAVYALAEGYTLSNGFNVANSIPGFREAVVKGGQFILDNQHNSGSWDYNYDTTGARGGDNSIGGWHMQAVKACKLTGLPEFKGSKIRRVQRKGLDFMDKSQKRNGGISYYKDGNVWPYDNGATLAAVGALSWQINGRGRSANARRAIKCIIDNMQPVYTEKDYDLYGHYYAAQALLNKGGEEWKDFNKKALQPLLDAQLEDGSWGIAAKNGGTEAVAPHWNQNDRYGLLYRTCLAALTLETYYRFLPASRGN